MTASVVSHRHRAELACSVVHAARCTQSASSCSAEAVRAYACLAGGMFRRSLSCKSVSISLVGEAVRASAVRTPAQFLDECRPQSFTSNQDPVVRVCLPRLSVTLALMLPSVVLGGTAHMTTDSRDFGPVTTVIVNPVQATPVEAQLLLHLACMFTLLSVSDKNKFVYARHMFRRAAGQDGTMAEKPVWS